jgi:glyoxylase-like metal-dependent hydrolase (beta-lactamase superfamily II)
MHIRSITAPNPGPLTLDGTETYLLGDSAILDPGPDIASHVEALLAAMPRLETILITHRHADHAPAAVPLKRATGARIVAPAGVLDDASVDRRVSGGETIGIEGTVLAVVATPGHTSEHVCYLTAEGDLFTGDTILGSGTTAIFPPDGHMGDYLRSLAKLRALAPKRIYPAHGPVRDDAIGLIDEYVAHRLERERQVLEAIHAGATSLAGLRALVYPDLDPRLSAAAEIQLRAHVIKLEEEGSVPSGLVR